MRSARHRGRAVLPLDLVDRSAQTGGSRRDHGTADDRSMRRGREFPAMQTRTCVHCGSRTTFTLDPGGWYACVECGRYS